MSEKITTPLNLLDRVGHLKKWHHAAVVFILGAITSLGLPPLNFSVLIFLTFPILIFILDGRYSTETTRMSNFKSGFATGWWFGFGYFVISLYWIGASFLVEADKFAIFIPFAVLALPAGLAIFWGVAVGLCLTIWQKGWFRLVLLASFLAGFEWLRGHVFTGLPWNTIGYISDGLGSTNQLASVIGVYGLTFFVVLWAAMPLCFFGSKRNWLIGGFLSLSLAGSIFWGMQREGENLMSQKPSASQKPIIVRIVQPNIAQSRKWDPKFRQENIDLYFSLSQVKNSARSIEDIDILVWPESALPLVYKYNADAQTRVKALLPKKTLLIMGALRRDLTKRDSQGRSIAYNSVLAINNKSQILASYDKSHLVPFGEYLPGEKFLGPMGLRKIVDVPYGFSSGPGAKTTVIEGYPSFSSVICYEIIFPGKIIDHSNRPKWIVNVTNDAWFGNTAGPYQHLAQTRFRAIETGLPVVRAANTGISALIGPYGNIIAQLKLGQQGVLDVVLPKPVATPLYSRFGDSILFFILTFNLFSALILLGLTKITKSRKV